MLISSCCVSAPNTENNFSSCDQATITLLNNDRPVCYAAVIGPHVAITANHCLNTKTEVPYYSSDFLPFYPIATVLKTSKIDDLALLKLESSKDQWSGIQLYYKPKPGDLVSVAGKTVEILDTDVWIKSVGDVNNGEILSAKTTITTRTTSAVSGTPLCDYSGRIVGIYIGDGIDNSDVAYYATTKAIIALIKEAD